MFNAIHITHEAVDKVGGIGTVLEGLINSRTYRDEVARTVLVCPLFYPERADRLGPAGVIDYSSLDQIYGGPYAKEFANIEREFGVRVVYGRRPVEDEPSARRTVCEVLLIDLRGIHRDRVNHTKGQLWEHFGLRSDVHEHIWEYDQYVQLAPPAVAALEAMKLGTRELPAVAFGHEFMGLPTALALQVHNPKCYRTLFYAHEVAPVRRIVEREPGHDVMFYNAMNAARRSGLYLDQVFGPQHDYFKHALVLASRHCDGVLAVGQHVQSELRFISGDFESIDIALAYNGIPCRDVSYEARQESRARLQPYFDDLLGWQPDLLFTHVTRLARSKAMWRDLDVLAALDGPLGEQGRKAVLLSLSTEVPRRRPEDILTMERDWNWPLAHREGAPDLTDGEAEFYRDVQAFNARARNVRVVFVNQFGFDRARCGMRVPADVEFLDLRRACDVELGLSLYEPFGISPLEPLTYGGLCVLSTSCGCANFVKKTIGARRNLNVLLANYIDQYRRPRTIRDALAIDHDARRSIERRVAKQVAEQILKRLPQTPTDEQRMIRTGYELAKRMSWDVISERFVFPAIRRARVRRNILSVA